MPLRSSRWRSRWLCLRVRDGSRGFKLTSSDFVERAQAGCWSRERSTIKYICTGCSCSRERSSSAASQLDSSREFRKPPPRVTAPRPWRSALTASGDEAGTPAGRAGDKDGGFDPALDAAGLPLGRPAREGGGDHSASGKGLAAPGGESDTVSWCSAARWAAGLRKARDA